MNELGKPPIFLVGMPGAGKTTIGRQLARRMHREFIDLDHELEARTGVKIPLIFEYEGENGFRDRESALLKEIAMQSDILVATGGGVVLRPGNRQTMRDCGVVVYLSVCPELLHERTRNDQNRPLLQVADPLSKLKTLFAERNPLYLEAADIVVTSTGGGTQQVMRNLERELTARA